MDLVESGLNRGPFEDLADELQLTSYFQVLWRRTTFDEWLPYCYCSSEFEATINAKAAMKDLSEIVAHRAGNGERRRGIQVMMRKCVVARFEIINEFED